jgi:DNA-directed RNA polymerase subunit RPC12/RpoP
VRYSCPHCSGKIEQVRNTDGPNFCPNCQRLFCAPQSKVPAWVWGVLVFLTVNWQILWIASHRL